MFRRGVIFKYLSVKQLRPTSRISSRYITSSIQPMASVSDRIIHDHEELKDYYGKIKNAGDEDSKVRWRNQFVWELARHSLGEELVVYPAMEKHLGAQGKKLADKDRAEHQEVKNILYEIQKMDVGKIEFDTKLDQLMKSLSQHIKEEERDDLPALEKAIGPDKSESMGKSFNRTKLFVPTHSHPSAPNKPPFETVVGLMTAPMDHILDLFSKFPNEDTN